MGKSTFRISAFADEASPNFDEQIEALKQNRIGLIEVRGVNGKSVMDLTDEEAQEVRAKLDAAGIALSALGSPLGKIGIDDDFDEHMLKLRRAFELCRILGTDKIRMFSFYIPEGTDPASRRADVLARLEKMIAAAEKEGILLCHENERAIYGEQDDKCVDLMEQFYPRMKNVFDPANYVVAKVVPAKAFPSLMQYTQYMHIKDAVLEDGAIVPSGAGDGGIKEILGQIGAYREDTILTVEPHLTAFTGLNKLQHEGLKHKFSYPDSKASFKAACDALKGVLTELGYTEDVTRMGVWTK